MFNQVDNFEGNSHFGSIDSTDDVESNGNMSVAENQNAVKQNRI